MACTIPGDRRADTTVKLLQSVSLHWLLPKFAVVRVAWFWSKYMLVARSATRIYLADNKMTRRRHVGLAGAARLA